MEISKIVAVILIIGSLVLGYTAYNKISQNSNAVTILGVKLKTSNESAKKEGYITLGLAVLVFAGGIYNLNKSKN